MISGKHFKAHEVSCCIKYFIFGFNIIFWVRSFRSLQACCCHCSCSAVAPTSLVWRPWPSLGGLFFCFVLICHRLKPEDGRYHRHPSAEAPPCTCHPLTAVSSPLFLLEDAVSRPLFASTHSAFRDFFFFGRFD